MEESGGGARANVVKGAVRKRRSQPFRRPRPDETNGQSSSSPAQASDDASKGSSDEINGVDTNSRRKEFNLNQCTARVSSSSKTEDDGGYSISYNNEPTRSRSSNKRSNEGVLAPANRKNGISRDDNSEWQNGENPREADGFDEFGNESTVKKVKLKVGGVTRTISTSNGAAESGSSKNSQASHFSRRGKQNAQGNSEFTSSLDKKSGLKGIPWKDFSKGEFSFGKRDPTAAGKTIGKTTATVKKEDKSESVRKSKRVPKSRLMDGEFDEDDDDEIRFVQKLKATKVILVNKDSDEEPGKKHRKLASVSDIECTAATKANKDGKKKLRTEDTDYMEEEEAGSDGGVEGGKKNKKQKNESIDNLMENNKKEAMALTTRQRALQSSKDASSLIEFPNGLPPVPSKKQKEKLTEVEQQLKKAEAAQRRKIQNEKAARESEAEAIRKILGQDSNRKKKEDKIKKRQEALAEEKAATALLLSGSTVRWVMGPTGTTVTFPNEMGLPKMFDPKPCSYPPPRENCAGPACSNPYKYRDSKTNLPLCSLQCYKAVQQDSAW